MQSKKEEYKTFFPEGSTDISDNDVAVVSPKKKRNSLKIQETVFIVVLMIIPLLHVAIFFFYKNMSAILLAFQDARTGDWTLDNFPKFWEQLTTPVGNNIGIAFQNTMIYFGNKIFLVMPLSLIMSFFLYKKVLGYKVFRNVFYLPAIISSLVMVTAYTQFINPKGPLDQILTLFGQSLPPEGLLGREETATTAIAIFVIWTSFTTDILLFSGAMSRVPFEIIEAAKLDGCGPAREILSIIFPLIWPTYSTQFIFAFTGLLSSTGPILLFTNGKYGTTTISFWMFNEVYGDGTVGGTGSYSMISCAGLCFSAIVVPLTLFIRWLVEKIDVAEY